jgi:hypothetical protein
MASRGSEIMSKSEKGRALVLTEKHLSEEIFKNNPEVLLVTAAALNPTMFSDKVEFLTPTDPADEKNYIVIRIPETGNAYAIHYDTVAKLAIQLQAKAGTRSEVLGGIVHSKTPRPLTYVQ